MTGAVASKRVTEALKGSLSMDGNHAVECKRKRSLTARLTGRAVPKVGVSDRRYVSGNAVAQRIKLPWDNRADLSPRVHIDGEFGTSMSAHRILG